MIGNEALAPMKNENAIAGRKVRVRCGPAEIGRSGGRGLGITR